MVEQVGERLEGAVTIIAPPVAGVFRQVQRQRPVGAEKSEEIHPQPAGFPFRSGFKIGQRGGRVDNGRFLAQTQQILFRADALTETGAFRVQRLQMPHDGVEAEPMWRGLQSRQQRLGAAEDRFRCRFGCGDRRVRIALGISRRFELGVCWRGRCVLICRCFLRPPRRVGRSGTGSCATSLIAADEDRVGAESE